MRALLVSAGVAITLGACSGPARSGIATRVAAEQAACALASPVTTTVRTPEGDPVLIGAPRLLGDGRRLLLAATRAPEASPGLPARTSTPVGAWVQSDGSASLIVAPFVAAGPMHVAPDGHGGVVVLTYRRPDASAVQADSTQDVQLTVWHGNGTEWQRLIEDIPLTGVQVDPGLSSRLLVERGHARIAYPFHRAGRDAVNGVLHLVIPTGDQSRGTISVDTIRTPALPTYVSLAEGRGQDSTLLLLTAAAPTAPGLASAPRLHGIWLGRGARRLFRLEPVAGEASSMMPEATAVGGAVAVMWTRSTLTSAASTSHVAWLGRSESEHRLGASSSVAGVAGVALGPRLLVVGKDSVTRDRPTFWLLTGGKPHTLPTPAMPFDNSVPSVVALSDSSAALVTVGVNAQRRAGAPRVAFFLTTLILRCGLPTRPWASPAPERLDTDRADGDVRNAESGASPK